MSDKILLRKIYSLSIDQKSANFQSFLLLSKMFPNLIHFDRYRPFSPLINQFLTSQIPKRLLRKLRNTESIETFWSIRTLKFRSIFSSVYKKSAKIQSISTRYRYFIVKSQSFARFFISFAFFNSGWIFFYCYLLKLFSRGFIAQYFLI